MSYEKVKSIKIDEKENKVWIKSACNNVIPLNYEKWECVSLSKILKEKGKDAVEFEILKSYEGGNFQKGNKNKYTRALKVLRFAFAEEYKQFDWRQQNAKYGTEEYKKERELRESQEFKDLLLKALKTKIPKQKYAITQKYMNRDVFGKLSRNRIHWTYNLKEASLFDFEQEAKNYLSWFSNNENITIIKA